MIAQLTSPMPRFSGKNASNSTFARQFKPGETVYILTTREQGAGNPLDVTLEKTKIKKIEPHAGQADSRGLSVSGSDLDHDTVDKITFTNAPGKPVLVGGYSQAVGAGTYDMSLLDSQGQPVHSRGGQKVVTVVRYFSEGGLLDAMARLTERHAALQETSQATIAGLKAQVAALTTLARPYFEQK